MLFNVYLVFVPKRRRKVIFGKIRRALGPIFHELVKQKECQIHEGHLMSDHVHMLISIPPKYAVASVIGFLKGKSAIAIARRSGRERNFAGEHSWARGYSALPFLLYFFNVFSSQTAQYSAISSHPSMTISA